MDFEDLDRLDICGTCAGQGSYYAEIPCICDNKGTADAELDGLRRECIRLRAQIGFLIAASEAKGDADALRAGVKHAYAISRARHAALLQAASAMCDFCRQSIPATKLRSGDYRHVYEERFCHAAAIREMIEREFGGANGA